MKRMDAFETQYNLAMSELDIELASARISNTCASVNVARGCFSPTLDCKPVLNECIEFSEAVHHSRFSTRLSLLMPLMWLTNCRFNGFGMNVSAINLWTKNDFRLPLLNKSTVIYPRLFGQCGLNNLCVLRLSTLPVLSIWYKPSKSLMSFMGTNIRIIMKQTNIPSE